MPPDGQRVVVFMETGITPLIRKWWLILLLGIAPIVIGVLLLVNTDAAEFTLALLIVFGLLPPPTAHSPLPTPHAPRPTPHRLSEGTSPFRVFSLTLIGRSLGARADCDTPLLGCPHDQ